MINSFKNVVGKRREETTQRSRCTSEDNIKMYLEGIGCEDVVDWIHLAQVEDQCWALVNTVMNIKVP
jgi:hypothetical protein